MVKKNKIFMYPMQTPEYAEGASVFNITERNFQYDPLLNDTFHWHDYFEMEFFCEGEGTHMLNGKPHAINRGSIYLLTPSDFHTLYRKEESTEMKYYNINFNEYALSSTLVNLINEHDAPLSTVVTGRDYDLLCREFKSLTEEYNSENPMRELMMKNIFERIMMVFLRTLAQNAPDDMYHQSKCDSNVGFIVSYLRIHFREPVSLSDMAQKLHLTPNYIGELFKKEIGVSFTDYVRHLRLNYSTNLLVSTDMPIADISAQSGFHSASYFTMVFRLAHGKTPLAYRKWAGEIRE